MKQITSWLRRTLGIHQPSCLKKNLNAPRPSEHPPVRGKSVKTFLGGIIGCKDETSSWHLNGFPDGSRPSGLVGNLHTC